MAYWREKTLLFKTEVTYGTDAAPTGAANAIVATDVSLSPMEGQDTSRELELPWMGGQATIPTGLHRKLSFKVEAKASGSPGVAPVVGPLLLSCAMAEVVVATTSVTYSRVTSNHKSATIYLNIAGILYKMLGARGTVQLKVTAQGIVYWEFEFTGLFSQPEDQAVPAVTIASQLSAFPQIANTTNTPVFTLGGTAHVLRSFGLNLGNQVTPRLLIGKEEIVIPNFAESVEAQIEAVPLATLNPYALAVSGATQALILQHGIGAGKIMTVNVPRAQHQRPGSPTQADGIVEWPLKMLPLPNTGNDQLTIVYT